MTAHHGQLTLDLGQRPALGRDDFVIADSNRLAIDWIDRWPDWPGGALVVHGPAGCGKSHLCAVWRHQSGALEVDPAELTEREPPDLVGTASAVCCELDEAALAGQPALQRRLLHLFNLLREQGGSLLMTAATPPPRWPIDLPDLRSRLASVPAVEVGRPDENLFASVLIKHFVDRQLRVDPEIVEFLAQRMERSLTEVRRVVALIDEASLAAKRDITLRFVRDLLRRTEEADGSTHQG